MSVAPVAPVAPVRLRTDEGSTLDLRVERWLAPPSTADRDVLARAESPVLDVGCGPGRHVRALAEAGHVTLGIDVSEAAVRIARERGAHVLRRSVFDRIPGERRWSTALVLDGSIGIGGDPAALLGRLRDLLRPGGRVLVEVEPPGQPGGVVTVRVEALGHASGWFPWAILGADDLATVAGRAGLVVAETWSVEGRWFGCLAG